MTDTDTPDRTRFIARAVPREDRGAMVVAPGFHSAAGFELLQREAGAFTASSMVPDTFRDYVLDKGTGEWKENPQAKSNCIIALNMAIRMHADPLMVMQNLYIVHGVPAWSAKFLIGLFNTCGRFSTIRYQFSEKRDACFAWCRELASGDRIEGPSVSLAMAKAEGWSLRKGNKWLTMPEVMLTNRAASFLIRTTAPELSLGLPMREEAEDVYDVDAREVEAPRRPSTLQAVRDMLREAPAADTATDAALREQCEPEQPTDELPPDVDVPLGAQPPSDPTPPPVTAPSEGEPAVIEPKVIGTLEPKSLPLKDGALTPQDDARRTTAKPREKTTAATVPAFNADAYSRRIAAVADLDLLTLMRDEIASLPPSTERESLMAELDTRTRDLIGNSIDGENAS